MAYEKKTWECGETITAEALNHMEDGIEEASQGGAEPLLVNAVYSGEGRYDLNKTFGEIRVAFNSGRVVIITRDLSSETEDRVTVDIVQAVLFEINHDLESPYASGSVSTYGGNYSVYANESPYTLEALNAQYPFISD